MWQRDANKAERSCGDLRILGWTLMVRLGGVCSLKGQVAGAALLHTGVDAARSGRKSRDIVVTHFCPGGLPKIMTRQVAIDLHARVLHSHCL